MLTEIDINESLQLGRIVSESQASRVTWKAAILIGVAAWVYLLLSQLIEILLSTDLNQISAGDALFQFLAFLLYLSGGYFLVYQIIRRMFTMERLTCVQGPGYSSNRTAVEGIVRDNSWRVLYTDDRLITVLTNKPFAPTRQLTAIFQDNNVWVNIMSFGLGGISPLYFFKDREVLNSFLSDFNRRLDAKTNI